MIRKREKPLNKITEDKQSDEKSVSVDVAKKPQHTPGQLHSFEEEAIMVLNILESEGIDIYDPSRTPGMYLKRRNASTANLNQQTISKILHKSSESKSSVFTSEIQQAPTSLVEFMAKQK